MQYQYLSLKVTATALSLAPLAGLSLPCRVQENPTTPTERQQQPESPKHQDAPAPEPHPELKPLVDAILKLIDERKHTDALQQADALLQQSTEKGDKIGQAYAHQFRAQALQGQNQLDEALPAWEQAERLWREIGDGAFLVEALLGRSFCLWRTDEAQAKKLIEQALEAAKNERRRPLAAARALNNLGVGWYEVGVLSVARQCFKQALELYHRSTPDSPQAATVLNNLGLAAVDAGDLDEAQRYFEQALAILERIAPNTPQVAAALDNLGTVARERGDLALAQRYYEQALAIKERLAPNSPDIAATLNNLGNVAYSRGDLDVSQRYYEQALRLTERFAPNSLSLARTLGNLGNVAHGRGDLEQAQRYYEQALAIQERLAPNSLEVARTLHALGETARQQRALENARRYYEQALTIQRRLAPNALQTARTLRNLAMTAISENQPRAAIQRLQQAVEIIEAQLRAVADPETRALSGEEHLDAYSLLAVAHLQLNQPAQAAEALERSRARSLAETLQQRQLAFAENTPQSLRQLLQQQQQLNAKRLQIHRQLQHTNSNDTEKLQRTLRELDQQQRALNERLRKEFPNYANLAQPKPLTLQQIQQSLDAGTVLLYHALVEDYLLMVAVSRTEVRGIARKVDGKQLERQIAEFRAVVSRHPLLRDALQREEWQQQSQRLYVQLIAPVQGMLRNAQRVLLCPDGVLSQLPWAALVVKTENGKPVYWMERVAMHYTPSVGVYRQARAVQPTSQGVAIVAVAQYSTTPQAAGTPMVHMPGVQQEVRALQNFFGRQVRVALNAQATPQRAWQLAANARVVHFACQARADNADPLGSALLLAPAESDVGRLTAGEVMLNWRLRADLVMLSASETALGLVRRHEGAYSLARAFLIAGARSVGASFVCPSDEATAELMREFYQRYARGAPKDEALRKAQLELRRNARYADPYFWAGFILIGDYRTTTPPSSRK